MPVHTHWCRMEPIRQSGRGGATVDPRLNVGYVPRITTLQRFAGECSRMGAARGRGSVEGWRGERVFT